MASLDESDEGGNGSDKVLPDAPAAKESNSCESYSAGKRPASAAT